MPVHLEWDDPYQSTIRADFIGKWSWAEFEGALKQVIHVLETTPYPVHLLVNGLASSGLPRGSSPFPHINGARRRLPENTGQIVVVTRRTFVKMIIGVANRFSDENTIQVTGTLEEGHALLAEYKDERQARHSLIRTMASSDNYTALTAVEELRAREWLYDGSLTRAVLVGADLRGCDLFMANLHAADLSEATLANANLFMTNLQGANLSRADLSGASLAEADLTGGLLVGANLRRAELSPCVLVGANLRGAQLWAADLLKADLQEANLQHVDLRRARLSRARLYAADLEAAAMMNAQAYQTVFDCANLSNANLSGADLRRSSLRGARLVNARLEAVDLRGAQLGGADFSGSRWEGLHLDGADFDTETVLPDGRTWTPETDLSRYTDPEHPQHPLRAYMPPREQRDRRRPPARRRARRSVTERVGR